ncbi:hypothetical protein KCP73_19130 [Salmonella enterica subsp. enterica]|nr:hypothetical protein KCP73_19130 [Salmonella enterica subsp. enterica]
MISGAGKRHYRRNVYFEMERLGQERKTSQSSSDWPEYCPDIPGYFGVWRVLR